MRTTDANDDLFFEHAQKFGRASRAHVTDFVQKQCATAGKFKLSLSSLVGVGEGAFFVAKQFAFDQIGGQSSTIDLDHRPIFPTAQLVQSPRDQFLARPAFSGNQDGRSRIRNLLDLQKYALEGQAIADRMTNNSFVREIDGEEVTLTDKQLSSYSNSLNSVMYFAFLPYFLEDQAVQLNYQGVGVVRGEPHYKVKVTFAEEGGGKDFEDEYVYWFAQDDFQLNYLAYNFLVNGGGARFREAYNARQVGGILFQDYINYKPTEDRRDVLAFDALLDAGALDTLSKIELVDITVE